MRTLRYTFSVDSHVIRHALEVARARGFVEVEIEDGASRFQATLPKGQSALAVAASAPSPSVQASNGFYEIRAPLVGFYKLGDPVLEPGMTVEAGDVIGVITALGLANDVESPKKGEIIEVLVKDGDPVEFGQSLAKLKVSA